MLLKMIFLVSLLTQGLIFNWVGMLSLFSVQSAYSTGHITLQPRVNGYNSTRLIIIAFDDSPKSQFTLAKPILDKYGFKGNFFTVCNFVNNGINRFGNESMSWQNIKTLQQQGHDIESHTMTHTALYNRSQQDLIYEI